MEDCYDVDSLCGLESSSLKTIKAFATRLFTTEADKLPDFINEMIDIVDFQMKQVKARDIFVSTIAVYFNEAFKYLCGVRKLRNSELYHFLRIVNHLPVLESSAFYTQTLDILNKCFREDRNSVKLFDKIQMLYLFVELEYYDGAHELQAELAVQIQESHPHLETLYQLCRFHSLNANEQLDQRLDLVLNTIGNVYHTQGPESTIFLMFQWLSSLKWVKHSPHYKAVLYNLFERIRNEYSLNSATVGYELFEMDSRLVNPESKMELYHHLISYPASILNSRQLRALHFFAGNYNSSQQDKFRESINSFKSSNYYLHKCWERLLGVSKYIRTHSDACTYKTSVAYIEKSLLQLSHYTSMRNNCYVENLQASFDQIEDLYREMGELSLTDALTGLSNRRYQEINMPQLAAFATRHKAPVCFAMMDIDLFKEVNDQHTHAAGDAVLKKLGAMMLKKFRKSDIVIRYGGDEFLMVLFDTELESASELLQKFKEEIASTLFSYQDIKIYITVSIGISYERFGSRDSDLEIDEFIRHSDLAMYEAKNSGRDMICIYKPPAENPA